MFFFFKQKTAYEMRISDWSSDVCSSDLDGAQPGRDRHRHPGSDHPGAASGAAAGARPRIRGDARGRAPGDGRMIFGPMPTGEAEGCLLAHSLRGAGFTFKKGRRLSADDIAALAAAGIAEVIAGRDRKSTRLNSRH